MGEYFDKVLVSNMYVVVWIFNVMVEGKYMCNIFFSLNLKTRAKMAWNSVVEYTVGEVMENRRMDNLVVMMAVGQVQVLVEVMVY